jgi:hypothetical protein
MDSEVQSVGCAFCGKHEVLRWRCESCARLRGPALFCSMACVWAHGPPVHQDPRTYRVEQSS